CAGAVGSARSLFRWSAAGVSVAFDEAVEDALLAGPVEIDRQLVALDRRDLAIAELLVENAFAEPVLRCRPGALGDEFALDLEWSAGAGGAIEASAARGCRAGAAAPAFAGGVGEFPAL